MCINKQVESILRIQKDLKEKQVLSYLTNQHIGTSFTKGDLIDLSDDEFKLETIDPNTVFYYYDGPLDEKTRGFCRTLLKQDKYYTQDDLDYLSKYCGYDVELYMGAYNCRHQWKRARLKGALKEGYIPDQPTKGEQKRAAAKSINVKE